MNPLAFIPAAYQVWARVAAMLLLVALGAGVAWTVDNWRLGSDLQALKAEHLQTVNDAAKAAQIAQAKAQADHEQLAADLALVSSDRHEDLTRRERAIENLRPAVASGASVVRVAAACPTRPGDVPQVAAGGRVDPGAGAVLAPDTGQRVLDLRAGAERFDVKLAACQAVARRLTGQGAAP